MDYINPVLIGKDLDVAIIAESNSRVTDNQKSLIRNILGKELSCLNTSLTNRRIIQTNAVGMIFQVLDETEDLLNQHNSDDAPACLLRILRRVKKELLRCDL